MKKNFLFVHRRAPHGTIYALESLDIVLAAAAFEQPVSLAFLDDGVYQLVKNQNTDAVGVKDLSPTYRALKEYDVDKIYVEMESLTARGLRAEDLLISVTALTSAQLTELMRSNDVVIGF